LEIFNANIEKCRVNEIPAWVCYVLGEEILRLQQCVDNCGVDPAVESLRGAYESYKSCGSLEGTRIGWEQSLDLDSLKSEKIRAENALQELRSKV
jgi:hypothetical protein